MSMNASELLRRQVRGSISALVLLQGLVLFRSLLGGTGFMLVIPALENLSMSVGTSDPKLELLLSLIPGTQGLDTILIVFLVLMVSMAAISYYNDILEERIEQSVITGVRKEIFQLTLNAEWQQVGGMHGADYSRIQTEEVEAISSLLRYLMEIVNTLITLGIYTLICLYLSPPITLVAAILGIAILAISYPIQKMILASGSRHLASSEHLYRQAAEQISGLRAIKSSQTGEVHRNRFDATVDELQEEEQRYTRLSSLSRLVNSTIAAIAFCLLAWSSTHWFETDIAVLIVIALVFSRLMPQVAQLQTLAQRIAFIMPSLEEVTDHVQQLKMNQESLEEDGPQPDLVQGIRVTDLSFRHPGGERNVLKNLSVSFEPGSLTLITGSSGIGKTTLADLLAGLMPCDHGDIRAGEIVLNQATMRAWRRQVTYVPQQPFLVDASIRFNLNLLSDRQASDEEITSALESACAKFVLSLPDGLDTMIGEGGSRLSAGERQRLILARSLLQDRAVLILDESMSNLDPQTETEFLRVLTRLKGSKTIIMISHRHHLAEIADQVITINDH